MYKAKRKVNIQSRKERLSMDKKINPKKQKTRAPKKARVFITTSRNAGTETTGPKYINRYSLFQPAIPLLQAMHREKAALRTPDFAKVFVAMTNHISVAC